MEKIKPLNRSDVTSIIEKFSPYVKEARKRVYLTLGVFAVSSAVGFIFYEDIIRFLISGLSLKGVNIVFTSPFQFINLAFSCGITTGVIVTIPLILIQLLSFLKPALQKREYKILIRLVPFAFFLFILGFIFGAVIMRWQIEIFLSRTVSLGIGNILDISGLLSTVFLTSTLLGVGFEFPVVLLLLMRIGILKPEQLEKKRLWVYLGSLVFTMLLPPDSVIADIALTLPLILLFESTLILNHMFAKK